MGDDGKAAFGVAATLAASFSTDPTQVASAEDPESTGPTPQPSPSGPRFLKKGLLGQGGMGRVHDAVDVQFGRRVALKELASSDIGLARRFVLEALITGNLEHPGIPAVYERGVHEGVPYYAMKKVEGRSLRVAIDEASGLEQRLALIPAVVQTAHTLGFAHARGVVHRDVKPDNVVLSEHGAVSLVDWGIAKLRDAPPWASDDLGRTPAADEGAGTMHGSVVGTPSYMAPEQARGEIDAIDERTDVFALGAILYHLLTGRAPYREASTVATLALALESKRAPIRELEPNAPPPLCAICDRAMASDPAARFDDARGFADALEHALAQSLVGRSERAARFAGLFGSVAIVAVAAMSSAMLETVSDLREQGQSGYIALVMTPCGLVLSAIEYWTRGRRRLRPLAAACALFTVLGAVAGTIAGAGVVARAAGARPPEEMLPTALQGTFEIAGIIPSAFVLAMIQIAVLVLVARSKRVRPVRARSRDAMRER